MKSNSITETSVQLSGQWVLFVSMYILHSLCFCIVLWAARWIYNAGLYVFLSLMMLMCCVVAILIIKKKTKKPCTTSNHLILSWTCIQHWGSQGCWVNKPFLENMVPLLLPLVVISVSCLPGNHVNSCELELSGPQHTYEGKSWSPLCYPRGISIISWITCCPQYNKTRIVIFIQILAIEGLRNPGHMKYLAGSCTRHFLELTFALQQNK